MKPKIAIIGVGLLGGSLARALRRNGGWEIVGWNHRASSRRRAAKLLRVAPSLEAAVRGAQVVVLCAHSLAVWKLLQEILPWLGKDTLVLDVSSLKKNLSDRAKTLKVLQGRFVPCHPMAGKEQSGPEASDADLYRDRWVFVTPIPGTPKRNIARAASLWRSVGAQVAVWDPGDHDRRVAVTSHLPHLLACALTELYGKRLKSDRVLSAAVGSGFRDSTRIAGGHPVMWADILTLNAPEISKALAAYRRRLTGLERDLARGDRSKWVRFFERSRSIREKL